MIGQAILERLGKGFVLYGHGVTPRVTDEFVESLHIEFSAFEMIINYLKALDYDFLTMDKMIEISQNHFHYHKHWALLTFDDGYANNLEIILPFLKSKQIPFTVFVSTNHIETKKRLFTYRLRCSIINAKGSIHFPFIEQTLDANASLYERVTFYKSVREVFKQSTKNQMLEMIAYADSLLGEDWEYYNHLYPADEPLSLDQLERLSKDELVTIGSHNHNHFRLNATFSEADIVEEMTSSKQWLQTRLNVNNNLTFAYPSGTKKDFSEISKSICKEAGYTLGFTTLHDYVDKKIDPYAIPRFSLPKKLSKIRKLVYSSIGIIRR